MFIFSIYKGFHCFLLDGNGWRYRVFSIEWLPRWWKKHGALAATLEGDAAAVAKGMELAHDENL